MRDTQKEMKVRSLREGKKRIYWREEKWRRYVSRSRTEEGPIEHIREVGITVRSGGWIIDSIHHYLIGFEQEEEEAGKSWTR